MTVASSASASISRAAAARAARSSLEALPAEREDRVRVETVERAQADHRVVLLAPDRPVVGAVGEGALEPGRVQLDGDLGRLARALEAALLGGRQDVDAGGDELVEERRQLGRGLDLDPLPEPDLRDGRAGLRFLEVGGDRLEPAGDRIESLGERRVVAGEQQEEAVADMIEGERATLPDAQDVRVEDRPADVVDLELALEARLGGERRRVDRLDRGEVLAVRGQLGEDGLAAAVAEQVVVLVEPERRAEDRVVADEPHEARLDEIVEVVVERARATPRARGAGAARQVVARSSGCEPPARRAMRRASDSWRWRGGSQSRTRVVIARAPVRLVRAPPSRWSRPARPAWR